MKKSGLKIDLSKASQSVRDLNPHLSHPIPLGRPLVEVLGGMKPAPAPAGRKKTRPEIEMEMILAGKLSRGEVLKYRYEGLKLAWGVDPDTERPMVYTPDFVVENKDDHRLLLIEVKGPHIFKQDLIRFKGCRSEWPVFKFEMHQRSKDGSWARIY